MKLATATVLVALLGGWLLFKASPPQQASAEKFPIPIPIPTPTATSTPTSTPATPLLPSMAPALSPLLPSSTTKNPTPRLLKIEFSISDPADLKVKEGEHLTPGHLIAERSKERSKLEAQHSRLQLALERIRQRQLIPPPPLLTPPPLPTLPPAHYPEEESAIAKARLRIKQLELLIATTDNQRHDPPASVLAKRHREQVAVAEALRQVERQQQKIEAISDLPELPQIYLEHEQAVLAQKQAAADQAHAELQLAESGIAQSRQEAQITRERLMLDLQQAQADLGLAQAKLSAAQQARQREEYQHALTQARRIQETSQAQLSYTQQQQTYANALRDKDYQTATLESQVGEIEEKLQALASVKAPYAGIVRRIKVEKQSGTQLLVTLSILTNAAPAVELPLPPAQPPSPGSNFSPSPNSYPFPPSPFSNHSFTE
jgi:multidrug efflux pump subunit AcrA (membrane-fusion protein)